MPERIHLSKADITELEEEYVLRALRSGWIAPLGPDVDALEAEIAARVGVKHALALSSGTAALHLALIHLGAGPGKVVILPTMTFAATANAVLYTGAEPVLVDSQQDDGNVDPHLLITAVDTLLQEGHEIAAVMTVDLFGRTCDYDIIEPALAERGVPLIEDAAEALGATFKSRAAGSFGRAAALSFNGNKIMTTSGGGMLLSNDEALIAHARKLSTQAREPVAWYEHREVGYNYRMSNILAALGRAQLSRLDEMIDVRQMHRRTYKRHLTDEVRFWDPHRQGSIDNAWLTSISLPRQTKSGHVIEQLNSLSIEARYVWRPMHKQPLYAGVRTFGGGVSEALFNTSLCLPSGSSLNTNDIEFVANALLSTLESSTCA